MLSRVTLWGHCDLVNSCCSQPASACTALLQCSTLLYRCGAREGLCGGTAAQPTSLEAVLQRHRARPTGGQVVAEGAGCVREGSIFLFTNKFNNKNILIVR